MHPGRFVNHAVIWSAILYRKNSYSVFESIVSKCIPP